MNQHILKSGEYPSNLAVRYVGKEGRWPELCKANPQLKTHPTYGCVFPAVGTAINLPDSWPPRDGDIVQTTATTTITTPTSTTTVTSTVTPDLQSSIAKLLTGTSASAQVTAAAAVPASTAPASTTAPAASMTVIPSTTAPTKTAAMWDGNKVKIGLIMASVIALGVVAYNHIKKSGDSDSAPRTQKMQSNPKRKKRHPSLGTLRRVRRRHKKTRGSKKR